MTQPSAEDASFVQLYNKFTKVHNHPADCLLLLPNLPTGHVSQTYRTFYSCILNKMTTHLPTKNAPLAEHLAKAYVYHIRELNPTIELLLATICELDRICLPLQKHPTIGTTLLATISDALDRLLPPNCDAIHGGVDMFDSILTSARVLLRIEIQLTSDVAPTSVQFTTKALATLKRCFSRTSKQRQCVNVLLLLLQVYNAEASAASLVAWIRDLAAQPVSCAASPQLHAFITTIRMSYTLGPFTRITKTETLHMLQFMYSASKYMVALQDTTATITLPSSIKFDPCLFCKSNVLAHTRVECALIVAKLLKVLMHRQPDYTESLVHFYRLITRSYADATSFKCRNEKLLQETCRRCMHDFPIELRRLNAGSQAWSYLEVLCTTVTDITAVIQLDKLMAIHLTVAPTDDDAIMVNFIHISYMLQQETTVKATDWPVHEASILCALKRICALHANRTDVFDIDAQLASVLYKWRGLDVPRRIAGELLLKLLYCAQWFAAMERDKRELLMLKILSTVPPEQPVQALRVANVYGGYPMPDNVYAELLSRFEVAKKQQQQRANDRSSSGSTNQLHWYAAAANMMALDYLTTERDLVTRAESSLAQNNATEQNNLQCPSKFALFRHVINLRQEAGLLQRLQLTIRLYGKFVAKIRKLEAGAQRAPYDLEVTSALHALPTLADRFQMRSYFAETARVHRMVLELSHQADSTFSLPRINSIAFVAWNRAHFVWQQKQKQSLEGESSVAELDHMVEKFASGEMTTMIEQREHVSRRRQGLMLNVLFGVALFYADTGRMDECRELLLLGQRLVIELETKNDMRPANVHRMRYYAVQLKLITRYGQMSEVPPIVFAESIFRMCHNLYFEQNYGVNKFKCLLNEIIADVTQYCMVRRDYGELLAVLKMYLKLSFRQALMLTCARILVMWCRLELQQDRIEDGMHVLGLLDDCLGVFSVAEIKPSSSLEKKVKSLVPVQPIKRSCSPVRDANAPVELLSQNDEEDFSFLQRHIISAVSPSSNKYKLDHPNDCKCHICNHPVFHQLLFDAAVLYGLQLFVRNDYDSASKAFQFTMEHFYKPPPKLPAECQPSQADDPLLSGALAQTNIHLHEYYAHSLWHAQEYQRADEMLRQALEWWTHHLYADEAVRYNLELHLITIATIQTNKRGVTSSGEEVVPVKPNYAAAVLPDDEMVNAWIERVTGKTVSKSSDAKPTKKTAAVDAKQQTGQIEKSPKAVPGTKTTASRSKIKDKVPQDPNTKTVPQPRATEKTTKRLATIKTLTGKTTTKSKTQKPSSKFVVYVSDESDMEVIDTSQTISTDRKPRPPSRPKDSTASKPTAEIALGTDVERADVPKRETRARRALDRYRVQ